MAGQRKCFNQRCQAALGDGVEVCPLCGRVQPGAESAPQPAVRRDKTTAGSKAIIRIGTRDTFERASRLVIADESTIMVGRATPGDIGAALDHEDERFGDVSREHLTLHVDGYQVEVTDHSTRGTYMGDVKLPRGVTKSFPIPLTLRLASRCWMRIERAD
ncbi:FHA domain-containing protein [Actinoplanes missouriensis]|uniref:FHA domain-containing protein n=1 Tax=Actinoplanes missouriensis TaxID=1866 RepID=UPI0033C81EE0